MRVAYADPPYPGQSAKHYGDHPDYAGEVDHRELLGRLDAVYDGWLLHTSSTALADVLEMARMEGVAGFRIMAWVKPFAAFKRNVPVAYAWEPVLVKPCRKPVVSERLTLRDWIAAPITLKRGLSGAKPEKVCRWAFEVLGMEPDDELHDLYPGTGGVTAAWGSMAIAASITDGGRMMVGGAGYRGRRDAVKGYGCVKCQTHHYERDPDGQFREHMTYQSKHGIKHITERDWAYGRLVVARRNGCLRLLGREGAENG